MEGGASHFCIMLEKVVPFDDPPSHVAVVALVRYVPIHRAVIGVSGLRDVSPLEKCPIFTHGVESLLIFGEPGTMHSFPVSSQCGGDEAVLRVQTPYSGCQVLRATEEESGVTRPFQTLDGVMMPSVHSMSNKGREFKLPIGIGVGCRGSVPNLDKSTHSDREVSPRGAIGKCGDR